MPDSPAHPGLCWKCNYPLHSAFQRNCPECGHAFDPADTKTMNMGPPVGRLTRYIIAATGWPTIALALLATGALFYITGLSIPAIGIRCDELFYLMNVTQWKAWLDDPALLMTTEWITLSCILLWLLIVLLCGFRWFVRVIVWLRHRCCFDLTRSRRSRLLWTPILFLIFAALLLLGWPNRVADAWIQKQLDGVKVTFKDGKVDFDSKFTSSGGLFLEWAAPPSFPIDGPDEIFMLRHAITSAGTSRQRIAAMGIYLARWRDLSAYHLALILPQQTDPAALKAQLHLLGLFRRAEDAEAIAPFLDHQNAEVRAAAADAIGIIHRPYDFQNPLDYGGEIQFILSDPPIAVAPVGDPFVSRPRLFTTDIVELPVALRARLATMMLTAPTLEEREAAARALVHWPPDKYELRIAEWGVWLAEGADLKLTQSFLDEIPPFVHRTGNPLSEFEQRISVTTDIFKPILHVYASEAMSLDVQVFIRLGRPWVAYPKPDDLAILVGNEATEPNDNTKPALMRFDRAGGGTLSDVREGYPWMWPPHRTIEVLRPHRTSVAYAGVRWQSAIVSRQQPAWAALPDVGSDMRFQWWKRLRDVPSDYVSSRGETERFLYYDGPTLSMAPLRVKVEKGNLMVHAINRKDIAGFSELDRLRATDPEFGDPSLFGRQSIFIRVEPPAAPDPPDAGEKSPRVSGERISLTGTDQDLTFPIETLRLKGDAVRAGLKDMLTEEGLTGAEAEGLIESWAAHFFATPGQRLIVRLTGGDYNWYCPITIEPQPTKLVRVGLILYEMPKEK